MATSASAVKEAVKETVLGSDDAAAGPSSQSKARFSKRAVKDETGELFMGPDEFINAVAPENEDFVSCPFFAGCSLAADPAAPVCCCAMESRALVTRLKKSLRGWREKKRTK